MRAFYWRNFNRRKCEHAGRLPAPTIQDFSAVPSTSLHLMLFMITETRLHSAWHLLTCVGVQPLIIGSPVIMRAEFG